jgi:hypothetical protein
MGFNMAFKGLNITVAFSQQSSPVFATHKTRIILSFVLGIRRKTQTHFVGYTHIISKAKARGTVNNHCDLKGLMLFTY